MGCIFCENRFFSSCFLVKVHKHLEGEKGYIQLLEVERSKNEIVFIINEFFEDKDFGSFTEFFSLEDALEIYLVLSVDFSTKETKINLMKDSKKIKKIVTYKNNQKPWFYHPRDRYLLSDIFAFS